jgi:dihydrofolate reductase
MNISIITAMTIHKIIGLSCGLPWKIKQELLYFQKNTLNKVVIMGSNTFASINYKPLINRQNIVLTKNPKKFQDFKQIEKHDNLHFVTDVTNSLKLAEKFYNSGSLIPEVMVIGGREIYQQFLPLVNKLYISIIKNNYPGDIYFPEFNLDDWQLTSSTEQEEFIANIYVK